MEKQNTTGQRTWPRGGKTGRSSASSNTLPRPTGRFMSTRMFWNRRNARRQRFARHKFHIQIHQGYVPKITTYHLSPLISSTHHGDRSGQNQHVQLLEQRGIEKEWKRGLKIGNSRKNSRN